MTHTERLKDCGIFLLRVGVGTVFVAHGAQKLFQIGVPGVAGMMGQLGIPLPMLSAVALTLTEFLGGLALLTGFLTRWAAVPIAFAMGVAALTVHLPKGFFLPEGVEFVFVLFLASVALMLTGAGAFSIDRLRKRRREEGAVRGEERREVQPVHVR